MSKQTTVLCRLLEKILTRRAVLTSFKKATEVLEAQLQDAMTNEGAVCIDTPSGGRAVFSSSSSTKMPVLADTVLRLFDPRTMAALLAGSTINKTQQSFLERVDPNRNLGESFIQGRTSRFSINLPRSKESIAFMQSAIKTDEKELNKKVDALFKVYLDTVDQEVLPENPKVDEVLKEDAKKAAEKAKKKASKKKASKKKKATKKKASKKKK